MFCCSTVKTLINVALGCVIECRTFRVQSFGCCFWCRIRPTNTVRSCVASYLFVSFIRQRSPHYKAISYYDLGWLLCLTNSWLQRPPSVRQVSFSQILPNLLRKLCCFLRNIWALMWCGILPSLHSLIFGSCSSVPTFAGSLTSVHLSRKTTLRLANVSGINPAHSGLAPYGLCFCHILFLFLHRNKNDKNVLTCHSRHTSSSLPTAK